MEKLNLNEYTTNKEVVTAVRERVNSVDFNTFMKAVDKEFISQDKAARAIYTGLSMGMNVFLSGPGGYGKSSLVKFVLKYFGIPQHTIVGYKDMPVDALLGIPNMQKLVQDSEYELAFSKCIFGKRGVVIGEEFTDILPSTAAALKDVLTEKGFRMGEFKQESFISSMIICANKSSKEVSDDESKKALYDERFPLKVEVNWPDHSVHRYMKLLTLKFPKGESKALYFMAKLFETNHLRHNNTITPRKASNITSVFLLKGVNFISEFDINLDSITQVQRQAEIEFNRESKATVIKSILSHIKEQPKIKDIYPRSILYALYRLNDMRIDEECIDLVKDAEKELINMFDNMPMILTNKFSFLKGKFNLLDD